MGAAHLNRVVCIVDRVIAARHGRVELQFQGQAEIVGLQSGFKILQQCNIVPGPPLFRDGHIHIAQAAVVDVIDRLGADLLGRAVGDLIAVVGGADGMALVVGVAGAGVEEGLRGGVCAPCGEAVATMTADGGLHHVDVVHVVCPDSHQGVPHAIIALSQHGGGNFFICAPETD